MRRRHWLGISVGGSALLAVLLFIGPIWLRPASHPVAAPPAFESPSPIPARSPSSSPLPSIPPIEPDPHGLAVVIMASELGFVSAKTDPGAVCTATASVGGDIGLEQPRTANAFGQVEFSYRTAGTIPTRGIGIHTVSCTLGDRRGSSTTWYNASGA